MQILWSPGSPSASVVGHCILWCDSIEDTITVTGVFVSIKKKFNSLLICHKLFTPIPKDITSTHNINTLKCYIIVPDSFMVHINSKLIWVIKCISKYNGQCSSKTILLRVIMGDKHEYWRCVSYKQVWSYYVDPLSSYIKQTVMLYYGR